MNSLCIRSASLVVVCALLTGVSLGAQAITPVAVEKSPAQLLQLAAVQTRRTVERVEREEIPAKPYQQVPLTVSAPTTSVANKPFIVIYRFSSPASGFTRNLINITKGRLTYFAGNQARTVYRILVVPDKDLHLTDDPYTTVAFTSPVSGDLTRKVRIIEPPSSGAGGDGAKLVDLEPSLLGHVLASRGGDNVTGSNVQIGNTLGFQLGFTYPLPSVSTILDQIIPRGSVRVHLGYEELTAGSKSKGTYNKFSAVNADLLYEIIFSGEYKFIAGMAMAFNPKMESQNLELRDISELQNADVEFQNAYGVKILVEYSPFDIFSDDLNFYINFGFVILDYLPEKIVLNETSTLDTKGQDVLSSPTRVGGSSFKLALGLRY